MSGRGRGPRCASDYAEEHNAKQAELLEAHIIKTRRPATAQAIPPLKTHVLNLSAKDEFKIYQSS